MKTLLAAVGTVAISVGFAATGALADAPPASAKKGYKAPAKAAPAKAAPAPAEHYSRPHVGNWGGLYFGANIGYAWGDLDWQYKDPAGAPGATSLSPSGGLLGGHIGMQHQFDRIVAGIELSWSGGIGNKITDSGPDSPAFAANFGVRGNIDAIFMAGGRLGVLVAPDWLLYGTAGYASARIFTSDFPLATGVDMFTGANRHDGWYLGMGVERQLHDRWIVGLDFKHVNLSTECHHRCDLAAPVFGGTRDIDGDVNILTFRLSYKLGRDDHQAAAPTK